MQGRVALVALVELVVHAVAVAANGAGHPYVPFVLDSSSLSNQGANWTPPSYTTSYSSNNVSDANRKYDAYATNGMGATVNTSSILSPLPWADANSTLSNPSSNSSFSIPTAPVVTGDFPNILTLNQTTALYNFQSMQISGSAYNRPTTIGVGSSSPIVAGLLVDLGDGCITYSRTGWSLLSSGYPLIGLVNFADKGLPNACKLSMATRMARITSSPLNASLVAVFIFASQSQFAIDLSYKSDLQKVFGEEYDSPFTVPAIVTAYPNDYALLRDSARVSAGFLDPEDLLEAGNVSSTYYSSHYAIAYISRANGTLTNIQSLKELRATSINQAVRLTFSVELKTGTNALDEFLRLGLVGIAVVLGIWVPTSVYLQWRVRRRMRDLMARRQQMGLGGTENTPLQLQRRPVLSEEAIKKIPERVFTRSWWLSELRRKGEYFDDDDEEDGEEKEAGDDKGDVKDDAKNAKDAKDAKDAKLVATADEGTSSNEETKSKLSGIPSKSTLSGTPSGTLSATPDKSTLTSTPSNSTLSSTSPPQPAILEPTPELVTIDLEPTTSPTATTHAYPPPPNRAMSVRSRASTLRDPTKPLCSICLERFDDGDAVRILPSCEHVFHKECVDVWLAEQSCACPLCRVDLRSFLGIAHDEEDEGDDVPAGHGDVTTMTTAPGVVVVQDRVGIGAERRRRSLGRLRVPRVRIGRRREEEQEIVMMERGERTGGTASNENGRATTTA
ncbi:hypothetical protein BJ742DRAFT_800589 [Cladochytrium replicatum]|nr:hypothetical protein BJ742DRAFT_800589 [Cladochytrium replicatum]